MEGKGEHGGWQVWGSAVLLATGASMSEWKPQVDMLLHPSLHLFGSAEAGQVLGFSDFVV